MASASPLCSGKSVDTRMTQRLRSTRALLLCFLGLFATLPSFASAKQVLIVVGPSDHPPGTHEVAAGARLLAHCLDRFSADSVSVETKIETLVVNQWPSDRTVLDATSTVVFVGDQFPPHQMPASEQIMGDLSKMMDRGCGIVCLHFATGLRSPNVAPDGDHPLLMWLGGYFASRCDHHKSVARIFDEATIEPASTGHPICRGWKPFTIRDEPYINNYFGPNNMMLQKGTQAFATSMLPPESPTSQIVSWGIERPDGGRGFAVVMPHFYRNWANDDLRTLILNGVIWSAGLEVPNEGAHVTLTDLNQFSPEQPVWPAVEDANAELTQYFKHQVETLQKSDDLRRFQTLEQWEEAQPVLRAQLADMLGLHPEPPPSDLQATVVGSVERDGVIVERLHYQSLPGLYVAANFYRPVEVKEPLPAVLYVCGHARNVETVDGKEVSYGNKTGYQRHGAWLARHGYVCLMIDTIQWGEFLGQHWGTYRDQRWDWVSLGYTPAGVEAWNGIRGIDYLVSRPEVDANRIAVTGRSGGGAYSWFVAALDQRVKVAIPVAGITDLENHVVDGCVSGHCDCMFFVNYHRWDYPTMAALVAPRPLLIGNSDRDSIFPLDGVARTIEQTQHVYSLYKAQSDFGGWITPGEHKDTYELQVGAFRWLDHYLKNVEEPIAETPIERFDRRELRVFEKLPEDQRVTKADEVFREHLAHHTEPVPTNQFPVVARTLRSRSFAGWPTQPTDLHAAKVWSQSTSAGTMELWEFDSQEHVRLRVVVEKPSSDQPVADAWTLAIADDERWQSLSQLATSGKWPAIKTTRITISPRGVGPEKWKGNESELIHLRRRFNLIGQTIAGMQTYDVLRAIELAQTEIGFSSAPSVEAASALAPVAIYSAALSSQPLTLADIKLPADYLSTAPLLGAAAIPGLDSYLRSFTE